MGLDPEISDAGKRTSLPRIGLMTKVVSLLYRPLLLDQLFFIQQKVVILKRRKKT
jgi:hypothetical protein